jgi:hypothetical protein
VIKAAGPFFGFIIHGGRGVLAAHVHFIALSPSGSA